MFRKPLEAIRFHKLRFISQGSKVFFSTPNFCLFLGAEIFALNASFCFNNEIEFI